MYLWYNNNIPLQTMPRPFLDINPLVYAPDKTGLKIKILLESLSIYKDKI